MESQKASQVFESINPYTNKLIQKFNCLSQEQIAQKIHKSWMAFQQWRKVPLNERLQKITKLASILEQNQEQLAQVLTQEVGKPLVGSRRQIFYAVDAIRKITLKAKEAFQPVITEMDNKTAKTIYQALGPIFSIQPWNFPSAILIYTNIQSLIAGNTILVKPAPRTPRTVLMMESYFQQAGLNNGEFQTLLAGHSQTDFIIGRPQVRGVNFTGSTEAGRNIAKICGQHIKKCLLELGGSDPFIVLEDANLKKAVTIGVLLRIINCGQNCMSPKRMLIHQSRYEEFKAMVIEQIKQVKIGDPALPETTMGPVARLDLLERLKAQVKETLENGATLGYGNQEELSPNEKESEGAALFSPIILQNISLKNPGYHYQFFGPVFCLYSFSSDDQALKIANGADYGLGATIFSSDKQRSEKLALEVEAGVVNINSIQVPNILIPFGGIKGSGIGREGGKEGFHEFTNVKTITTE